MDKITTDFFNLWMSYKHYSSLCPRPTKFRHWQGNVSLTHEYFNWIEKESNCPSLKLDIDVPHVQIYNEALNLIHEFVKHRGDEHPGWYSLVIHGFNKHTTDDWKSKAYSFLEKPEYKWTEISDMCPVTKTWLSEVWKYRSFDRVRFMLLEPGGYIKPHSDYETRKLAAYNIAINNPEGVEFVMQDGGLIPWKEGDARAIDIGRTHSVRHLGTIPRIHMIIHGSPTYDHIVTVCRSYDNLCKELDV